MKKVYARLIADGTPFIWTTPEAAELIKYAANAFLATKISFINEIANLCEAASVDIDTVARGMGLDKRIGGEFLRAGPGYGGSCFPKDTRALVHIARSYGQRVLIVETAVKINEQQKGRMVKKIRGATGGLKGKTIALLGMAFKPGVDDLRESPAVAIAERLLAAGARLQVHDPMALGRVKEVFGARINCARTRTQRSPVPTPW
jgi:UDPglucose 6-dehydrogenase